MPLRIISFRIFIFIGRVKMAYIPAKLPQSLGVPTSITEFKVKIKHF